MFFPLDERYHAEDGEYIGMYIHPRPYQQPHPPVWLMSNAPFSFEFAGRSGYNLIAMSSPKDNIRACWDAYKKAADEVRDKPVKSGENVGLCVAIYVADSMEQAAKDIRPAINLYYELLSGVRPSGEWMKKAYLGKDEELSAEDEKADWFDFLMSRGIILSLIHI